MTEKLNHEIRFKLTKEQHDKIKENSEKAGLSIKQFLLHLGMYSRVRIQIEGE